MAQLCLPQTCSAITVVRMNSLSAFLSDMRDDASCVRHNEVRWSTETITTVGEHHVNFQTLIVGYIAERDGHPTLIELRRLCGSISSDQRCEEIRAEEQVAGTIETLETVACESRLDLRHGQFTLDPSPLLSTPQDMLRAFCPTLLTPEGTTYNPWTDGWAVGLRCRRSDGLTVYLYLNPSREADEGHGSVFTYLGAIGNPEHDAAEHAYDPFGAHQPTRLYTVRTVNGDRQWQADSAQHAREQHTEAFAGQPGETIQEVFAGQPTFQPASGQ